MRTKFHNTMLTRHVASVTLELILEVDVEETVRLPAVIDVNEDGLPLGVEAFDVTNKLGSLLKAVTDGLDYAALKYGYDDQVDILTINLNTLDSGVSDQQRGSLYFNFTSDGRLAFLDVVSR